MKDQSSLIYLIHSPQFYKCNIVEVYKQFSDTCNKRCIEKPSWHTHCVSNCIHCLSITEIEPGKILNHLNRRYRRENYPDDYFVCIFLMVLDLEIMELTYTGAGFQESPLVQTGSGERLRLCVEGPPISTTIPEELMDYSEGKLKITSGTTVLVSTDGIVEQVIGEKQFSERLEQVFYEHSHLPPELAISAIKEDFYRFNNNCLQGDDDITLGIMQVEPEGKRQMSLELESTLDILSSMRQEVVNFLPETEKAEMFLMKLYELAANAIEHGNNLNQGQKVTVDISVTDQYMFASIKNEGPGFHRRGAIDKPLELKNGSKKGRGIAMTQMCGWKLYYNEAGTIAFLAVE